jgi:hypothetical protein
VSCPELSSVTAKVKVLDGTDFPCQMKRSQHKYKGQNLIHSILGALGRKLRMDVQTEVYFFTL